MGVANKTRPATSAAIFFRSYMRTSEKAINFRGNLSSPGLKFVLKIKRYAQRLSHRVCMGDGGHHQMPPSPIQTL